MNEPTLQEQCYSSLASISCPACRGGKKARQSFCGRCYFALPQSTRKALYVAEGYVETWKSALDRLLGK